MAESRDPKGQAEAGRGDYLAPALERLSAAVVASGFDLREVTLRLDEDEREVRLSVTLRITAELLDLTPAQTAPGDGGQTEGRLYSETEAAERLGVSRITLLRMRRDGRIGFYRIGVRVLFSEAEHIRPFLDGCNQRPATSEEEPAPRNERVLPEVRN